MHATPPPIALITPAIHIQRIKVIRSMINIMITHHAGALYTRNNIVPCGMQNNIEGCVLTFLFWMDDNKVILLRGFVTPFWFHIMFKDFIGSFLDGQVVDLLALDCNNLRRHPILVCCNKGIHCKKKQKKSCTIHGGSL